MKRVAILVDGGFYRRTATHLFGKKSAEDRAKELVNYCHRHLKDRNESIYLPDGKKIPARKELYRIFYYDCASISKVLYHPLLKKNVDFSKTETFKWTVDFLNSLKSKRKVALRLGKLADSTASFSLKNDIVKKLFNGTVQISDITENDFELNLRQKGVDMKIGIDIATLAYKKLVDQIVLLSGDSDFVPAAKLARREGIDFVLDSMGNHIADDLLEHIDGLQTYYKNIENNSDSEEE